jgi:hypothetical protein
MGSAALAVTFGFGILGRRMAAERTHVVVARTVAV